MTIKGPRLGESGRWLVIPFTALYAGIVVSALDKFVLSAREHGRFTLSGETSKTNAAYRRMKKASQVLRAGEDGGETAFSSLLDHADAAVRMWAAYYLLPINEAAANGALEVVASGKDLIALDARMTMSEWNAGKLQIL